MEDVLTKEDIRIMAEDFPDLNKSSQEISSKEEEEAQEVLLNVRKLQNNASLI